MFMKKNLTYKKINHSIAEKHNQVQIFEILLNSMLAVPLHWVNKLLHFSPSSWQQ